MLWKSVKYGSIALGGGLLLGGAVFGSDLVSYVRSSAHRVQNAVKDSVPIEFELQRARDLVEQIIPELHANIRLIAQEEVEIAALESDIERGASEMVEERERLARIRDHAATPRPTYTFAGQRFTRDQVIHELARRLERCQESEVALAGRKRLLETRRTSLQAAMQMLDRTRDQKAQLEQQIETLAGQHRLVQAAAVGSRITVDGSKLAQTQNLITQIRKRLDVAERVLAHEAHFVAAVPFDVINEQDLLAEVDAYIAPAEQSTRLAAD